MLTTDDVRKGLDLIPFEGFARKKANEPPPDLTDEGQITFGSRSTGRSTRMLCSALATASAGRRVAIYAKPLVVEGLLKDRAREWATTLGISPDLIVGHLAVADVEFFDHSWYDPLS